MKRSSLLFIFAILGSAVFLTAQGMQPMSSGFIPVVTAAAGGGGSYWQSDAWMTNPSAQTLNVEFWVWTGATRSDSIGKFYTLPPHSSLGVPNIVGDLGLSEGQLYMLNFNADGDVVIGSRTYTQNTARAGGTYGQFIPSLPYAQGFSMGGSAIFPVPLDFSLVRVNVGLANSGWSTGTATIKVYDNIGTEVSSQEITADLQHTAQVNTVNRDLNGYANGYVEVTITAGDPGTLYPYVSVVDFTGSNDPSFLTTLP